MKAIRLILIFILAAALCGACAPSDAPPAVSPTPTPVPEAAQGDSQGQGDAEQGVEEGGKQEDAPAAPTKDNRLYDPSIFVIEASGTWRQELAEGYYADYECELYLDKVDSNDNHVSDGSYHGFLWMKTTLDVGEYLAEFLEDVPVDMGFSAGGEGICDNLIFHLTTRDTWEQDAYAIPLDGDQTQTPELNVPVDKGSFIVVAKDAYLDAVATGKQGETLEYHSDQSGDVELSYIVHMQPDSLENGMEREVTIYLSDGQGMSATLHGVMRRLPGYPDDLAKYVEDAPYQQALNKHLS